MLQLQSTLDQGGNQRGYTFVAQFVRIQGQFEELTQELRLSFGGTKVGQTFGAVRAQFAATQVQVRELRTAVGHGLQHGLQPLGTQFGILQIEDFQVGALAQDGGRQSFSGGLVIVIIVVVSQRAIVQVELHKTRFCNIFRHGRQALNNAPCSRAERSRAIVVKDLQCSSRRTSTRILFQQCLHMLGTGSSHCIATQFERRQGFLVQTLAERCRHFGRHAAVFQVQFGDGRQRKEGQQDLIAPCSQGIVI
mmetsp:Transcript_17337/g.47330  ORF Transcript_17337/g.47330 Transcript_17337/m.47330 type:complete len:250 (-) Transcript_17337:503-1252(-)